MQKNRILDMRTALVAASVVFGDLGDKRKPEYLEAIIVDALERGNEMKRRVIDVIQEAGYQATEERICAVVFWNRSAQREHMPMKFLHIWENKKIKGVIADRKNLGENREGR